MPKKKEPVANPAFNVSGKHPFIITREKTALLVIDMQEKFRPAIPAFEEIEANIARLVLTFQMYGMPILVTEQYPQGLGLTVPIIKKQFPILEVTEKMEFACTDNNQFMRHFMQMDIKTVVVCGVETHVCVAQTALGLLHRGLNVQLAVDAVGTRKDVDHEVAIKKMERAGAVLTTAETIMFELCEKAGTTEFRNIQRMIKASPRRDNDSPRKELPALNVKDLKDPVLSAPSAPAFTEEIVSQTTPQELENQLSQNDVSSSIDTASHVAATMENSGAALSDDQMQAMTASLDSEPKEDMPADLQTDLPTESTTSDAELDALLDSSDSSEKKE